MSVCGIITVTSSLWLGVHCISLFSDIAMSVTRKHVMHFMLICQLYYIHIIGVLTLL